MNQATMNQADGRMALSVTPRHGGGTSWAPPQAVLVAAGLAMVLAGCVRLTTPVDAGHDHAADTGRQASRSAESFADALATIIELDTKIQAACAADDPGAAHDELHAIGRLLEELPELATTTGLPLDRAAVARAAEALFQCYSRIDDKLHGSEGSSYAEEADTIARELSAFRGFLVEHRP